MTRFSVVTVAVGVVVAGCTMQTSPTSTTTTTTTQTTLTAQLLPSNVIPPVTGGESFGKGDVTITLNVTKNAAGTVTAATADVLVTISGFGFDSLYVSAHVHRGDAGCKTETLACPVVIDTAAFAAPGVVFPAGSGTLVNKPGITVNPTTVADELVRTPGAFYFDVHTASNNLPGVMRGQLK